MEYTTPHTSQLKVVVERRFNVIKEGALAMLINAKLNDTDQKMIWTEALHMCKRTRKIMDTTGSKNIHSEISMEKNQISLVRSWSLDISATSLN